MYSFTPLTDEQLDSINLIEDGIYNFEVTKSTRKTSKSGNPMAELQLMVWDNQGKTHYIFDYLVFSQVNLNIKKISHFCKSVGLASEYSKGEIPEALEHYCGKVEVSSQDPQPKSTGGFYPKKNVVVDYVFGNVENKSSKEESKDFHDDDIPF